MRRIPGLDETQTVRGGFRAEQRRSYQISEDTLVHLLPWSHEEFTIEFLRAWLASRKEAGGAINIETCELGRWAANDCDPYGLRELFGELPEEMMQVGTNRFVRSPESRGWVWEGDLPTEKAGAMYARIQRQARAAAAVGNDPYERGKAERAIGVQRRDLPQEYRAPDRVQDAISWDRGWSGEPREQQQ
jgi:hypothetical protein